MEKYSLIFILYFLIVPSSWAATSARKIADQMLQSRQQATQLGARLKSLEKDLATKKNLHQSSLVALTQFEQDVALYDQRLSQLKNDLKKTDGHQEEIIHSYLMQSDQEQLEDWQRKVHSELLKVAEQKRQKQLQEVVSFEEKVKEFNAKIYELKQDETLLMQVIADLESKKYETQHLYQLQLAEKEKWQSKIEKQRMQKKLNAVRKSFVPQKKALARAERIFKLPIEDFLSVRDSAKGVTFKYAALQPLKAIGEGRVVYAGDLASYGQVIMVDHGSDLRSVLLGPIQIKVQKNDRVQSGDILGYTKQNGPDNSQNLYLEIRKNNTAQNTILWLDLPRTSTI